MKTYMLTQDDLDCIAEWYESASGESASGFYLPLREHVTTQEAYDGYVAEAKRSKALLDKLGIPLSDRDKESWKRIA